MTMQKLLSPVSAALDASAPDDAADGIDISDGVVDGFGFRHHRQAVTVTTDGTGTIEVSMYGLVNGVWGLLCDGIAPTGLLGGAALTGGKTYHFELESTGVASRLAFVKGAVTGNTTSATITVARVKER